VHDEVREQVPRRLVVRSLLRSATASALLVLAYYALPLDAGHAGALAWLVLGLAAVVIVGAVDEGLRRRSAEGRDPEPG
jgi:hypothetical protein